MKTKAKQKTDALGITWVVAVGVLVLAAFAAAHAQNLASISTVSNPDHVQAALSLRA